MSSIKNEGLDSLLYCIKIFMARKFAIGDIHGCNKTFKKLLLEVLKLTRQDELVLLGDYIDRGPDSLGVIQTILKLQNAGYTIHCLRGNHEQMMMDSATDVTAYFQWLFNGGEQTLASYNKTRFQDFPEVYRDFFNSTKLYLELDKCILVHAGLNFENENLFEDQDAMLWTRNFKIDTVKLASRILVHGHVPIALDKILAQKSNCFNIDGGCVFTNSKRNLGKLVAMDLENFTFHYTTCID